MSAEYTKCECEQCEKLKKINSDLLVSLKHIVDALQSLENNPISYFLMGEAYAAIRKATEQKEIA